jgi:hypothetical protein
MATGRVPTTANSPLTAKGDLFGYSTTQARVAVGNDGETLVADSSTSTGLRYTAGTVQANPVLNSAMQCWQRGTSFAIAASTGITYTADRWWTSTGANQAITVSRQLTNDTTNLPFIQYCTRYQRNSGQTGTGALGFNQPFESINSVPYAGKVITFSFYARKGADFSAASSVLNVFGMTGTGTDQNGSGAYTGAVGFVDSTATLTTTWQRFTYTTSALPTNTNEIFIQTKYTPVGTASTNDYYEVTGFQIDVGSVALPFRTYAGTIQGELSACLRYYYRNTGGQNYSPVVSSGVILSTTNCYAGVQLPVQMRREPTSVEVSALQIIDSSNTTYTVTSAAISTQISGTSYAGVEFAATGMTVGRTCLIRNSNNSAAYLAFNAEL